MTGVQTCALPIYDMIMLAVARDDGAHCFAGAARVIDDLAPEERLSA